jgi:ABC-2 type transport system permease protein
MTTVAQMEWRKLRGVRSTWWIMAAFAAGMVGLAILVMSHQQYATMSAADRASFDPTNDGFTGMALGQLLLGSLGVLAVTTEFSSGLIRATFAAVPSRPRVLAAKAAVLAVVTLTAGEILSFAAFWAGEAALGARGPHAALGQPGVLRAVLLIGAYPALIALIGLGLGAVIRHTAGAIVAITGVVFVLPLLMHPIAGLHSVQKFLPEQLAENSLGAVKPVADSLAPEAALAVLCGYAAVALAAGAWVLARRDA